MSTPIATEQLPARPIRRDDLGPLTRRASLNAAAALFDYGAKIGVALVVTPIILSGLGRSLFGVWEMLTRLGGYMAAADGRPTVALRLLVAQHQSDRDQGASRRYVGAALVVWAIFLPVAACVGAVLVWIAPKLTNAPPPLIAPVQLATALLLLSFMLGSLASVPESVLRGMNLSYKRMGVQAGLNVLGGGLAAAAVLTGFGLAGLASAQALRAAVTGLCFLLLVRAYVAWFGVSRPRWREVKSLFGMSAWLAAGDVVARIILASDVVVLGALAGPALVTTYVLTGHASRIAVGLHVFAADAAIPGLGGLLGSRQLDRASRARHELLTLTWLFATASGATILAWNRSFLALWVGAEHYAGMLVNLLVVLLAVQTAFIRVDAYIIDAALRPKRRVLVGTVAAVLTIGLSLPLTRAFGIVGLCAGILVARAVQSIAYPVLARASLGRAFVGSAGAVRLAVVTALVFGAAIAAGERIGTLDALAWVAGASLTFAGAAGVALLAGPTSETRRIIAHRLRIMFSRGRDG